ncbi:MAG: metallopeptidase family protein [Candidatus Dormibacteraeota bacterium]|nr:metallopeptidase family protein [Candidatus Dormibacteraeota bacterium]
MPLSDWFRRRGSGLDGRLQQALTEARAGDAEQAVATISERFPQALDALAGMGEPADAGLLRLTAWLAFRSGRMPEAAAAAEQALAMAEDPATWHLLGRIQTWLGSPRATDAFRRAARLDPDRFSLPFRVSREQFAALADEAFAAIPAEFRARMDNTLVVVDDLPELDAVREGEDPDILGIYEGATALDRGLPERIVLYQRNHEQVVTNAAELREEVHETMRHEIGHHFGMEEDELPY